MFYFFSRTYGQTPKQLFTSPHCKTLKVVFANRFAEQDKLVSDGQLIPEVYFHPGANLGVKNLKWGEYVGSPAKNVPRIVERITETVATTRLTPLASREVRSSPTELLIIRSLVSYWLAANPRF